MFEKLQGRMLSFHLLKVNIPQIFEKSEFEEKKNKMGR